MRTSWSPCVILALAVMTTGCAQEITPEIKRESINQAYCQAMVTGLGPVDAETDYLPRVVQCENGAAGFEALKAQAVAARSYLYYRLDRAGEIEDGQQDQVYGCGRPPTPRVHAAVRATSGQILAYRGVQVAGFYVAGAIPHTALCAIPAEAPLPVDDPFGTEHFVTYNAGLEGPEVTQTELGMVSRRNRANRGCKSQNGAACLAEQGLRYDQILRFYYGDDIEIRQATGPCIVPVAERGVFASVRAGAWIGGAAMLLALAVGWLLVLPGLRTGAARPNVRSRPRRQRRSH